MFCLEPDSSDAAFHFAAEEYFLRGAAPGLPLFMLWRTDKCVMLGRNQIADAEIDLAAAERLGVSVVRRSSGGGTIFTDPGTLLYTVLLPLPYKGAAGVKALQREYVSGPVVEALNAMGVAARAEGRNDITLGGRKISGIAQYAVKNALCAHGSLLYRANLDELAVILKPDEEKIKSKAVRSARGRVGNISDRPGAPETIEAFRAELKGSLAKIISPPAFDEYELTEGDVSEIEKIRAAKYASDEWTFAKPIPFTFHNAIRFPMGRVEVFMNIEGGVVRSCAINGDFLGLRPVSELAALLEGRVYARRDAEAALENADLEQYLGGVTREEFLRVLFD